MRDTPADEGEWHRLLITDAAYQAVKERAEAQGGGMVSAEPQQPDGMWPVILDGEVVDVLMRLQAPSETISDVLIRVCQHGMPKQS